MGKLGYRQIKFGRPGFNIGRGQIFRSVNITIMIAISRIFEAIINIVHKKIYINCNNILR